MSIWIGNSTAANIISGSSSAATHTASLLACLLSIYPLKEFDAGHFLFTSIAGARVHIRSGVLFASVSGFLPPVLGKAVVSLRVPPDAHPSAIEGGSAEFGD